MTDEPGRQRQVPVGWRPADGHLAVFGMVGSGTTTALLTVARSLAETHPPTTAISTPWTSGRAASSRSRPCRTAAP